MKKGLLIIISGPSGSGKGTVLAHIIKDKEHFYYSVSATTRKMRPNDVDGVTYLFISREEFDRRLETILECERWIIDGDYNRTYEIRIRSCDTVFFLDYEENECMEGIINRVGQRRTDIPWVENQLDQELVEQVRNYHRDSRPVIHSLLEKYPEKKTIVFKSRSQAGEWLVGQSKNSL